MKISRKLGGSVAVALLGVITACAPAVNNESKARMIDSLEEPSSRFFMANICSRDGVEPESRRVRLSAVEISRTERRAHVCVDESRKILLDPTIIRIFVVGPHENYIQLRCLDKTNSTIGSISKSGEIALVADGSVISTYHYLDKDDLSKKCGVVPVREVDTAVDICEDIVSRFDGNKEACSSVCDAETSRQLADICLVANGKAP